MSSLGSIYVDLLARTGKFDEGLRRASGTLSRTTGSWNRSVGRSGSAFQQMVVPINNVNTALSRLAGTAATIFSANKIIQYSDTWKQLEGRLSIVSNNFTQLAQTQTQLFEIAQRSRQPLEGVYNLYTRLTQAIPEAQRAQYDLLGVTESINNALAITGEGSAQAASAILQFTQAAASGFQGSGQEMNALLDSAPRLAIALQNAFGDGSKSLKQLSKDGELSLDVILRALSGAGEEGRKLREEFAKLTPTVGQAFTQLDNAFLKYIGQNDLVKEGTNSISAVVTSLATNFEILADAAVNLAAIMATRLVISFVANTQQVIAYQIALARMTGVAAAAAQNMVALSAVSTAASRALALVGGPAGALAIFGVALYQVLSTTDETAAAQQIYNSRLAEAATLSTQLSIATGKEREELEKKRKTLLETAEAEAKLAREEFVRLAAKADQGGMFGGGALPFIGRFTPEGRADAAISKMKAAGEAYRKLQEELTREIPEIVVSRNEGSGNSLGIVKEINNLNAVYEKNKSLITGVDQATLQYQETLGELNELYKENLLTNEEYIGAQQRLQEEFYKNSQATDDWLVDFEKMGEQAAENIQDSFADFLFDPFAKGTDGMLKGFIDTVRRMMAEASAAQLGKLLFGETGGGESGASGIFGKILGSLGSFGGGGGYTGSGSSSLPPMYAEGGFLEPGKWGIAGEREAEWIYGGRTGMTIIPPGKAGQGGNTYQIDARGADQSAVVRLEQALVNLAGPGVIERRVAQAQVRGAL